MQQLLTQQRQFFDSGATLSYKFRIKQLHVLKQVIKEYEEQIYTALDKDLGKPRIEAYLGEVGIIYKEIDNAIKHLAKWMKPQKVKSPFSFFYSKSYILQVPLGCVLIISPWNYPIGLLISPLIGAIAAGNCVVLKPSELSTHTANVLETMIKQAFDEKYIAIQNGAGAILVPQLIENGSFNHVLYTGSTNVGRIIAKQCAEKLIPYTLELGGKSPTIIDKTANLAIAAKRVIWGKFFNYGQTCIAPDYILVDNEISAQFIELLKSTLKQFDLNTIESPGKIINKSHFNRLISYLADGEIICGGIHDEAILKIAPTLLLNPKCGSKVMTEEIFGPILPITTYLNKADLISKIRQLRYPLSMYVFSEDRQFYQEIIEQVECGGVGINTCLYHFVNENLPFGGVMTSGNGYYHGKFSFDLFSHPKAIVRTLIWPDIPLRYSPYSAFKLKLMKLFT